MERDMSTYFSGQEYLETAKQIERELDEVQRDLIERQKRIEESVHEYSFPPYKMSQLHSVLNRVKELRILVREAVGG
jgi:hypothetical protein